MRITNEAVLQLFRGYCEWCHVRGPSDAHHVLSKGAGRIDAIWNCVGLCRVDHSKHHSGGEPTRQQLLTLVAKREQTTVAAILDATAYVRACDKSGKPPRAMKLSRASRALIESAGVIL